MGSHTYMCQISGEAIRFFTPKPRPKSKKLLFFHFILVSKRIFDKPGSWFLKLFACGIRMSLQITIQKMYLKTDFSP